MNKNLNIVIAAGEASGDIHAAHLVQQVLKTHPEISFSGMGGSNMHKAGVAITLNIRELSIIGAFDIISHFFKIIKALSTMRRLIKTLKPALIILVDFPGFNLRLAKIAKQEGVKVLYYISPKIWAWHQSRVHLIKKYVDLMAVIFPFEVAFYKKWGINAAFVGNPSLTNAPTRISKELAEQKLALNKKRKVIGLFPGSRKSEIKFLLPVLIKTAELLAKKYVDYQFILPIASSLAASDLTKYLKKSKVNIQLVSDQIQTVIQACDAIIAASGTVTLEIALQNIPMIIIYKSSWINYFLAKLFIKIPYLGLANILLNKKIIPELLQYQANPKTIAKKIDKIINDENYRKQMHEDLKQVKSQLELLPAQNLAEIVTSMALNEFHPALRPKG